MTRRTSDQSKLKYQSQGRAMRPEEDALAKAMLKHFAAGTHDFTALAAALQADGIARPSGQAGPWTLAVLEEELAAINEDLDHAYAENGYGA